MMVLGADMHKRSHTIAAVAANTGELVDDTTIRVSGEAFLELLDWARSLDDERVWALEDCRHVSGAFERFLIGSGERVLRVATKLMSDARRRPRAGQVRSHRRSGGRASGAAGGHREPAVGAAGRHRARLCGCLSITANG